MQRLAGALKSRLAVLAVLSAVLLGALASCNNSNCTDNHSALPLMGFYDFSSGKSMRLNSRDLSGVGAPDDSLLIHAGQAISQVYLPFRYHASEVQFCFHYAYPGQGLDDPALNDTITFGYTAEPYFASNECGAMYKYTVNTCRFTTHLIENVVITDSVITNIERERIQVFFRTQGPEEGGDL